MTSWLPNFTTWETGVLAAAFAVPALLILYFLKLRRREMAVSSTLLWKKAVQDLQVNAPFQRLRKNLLLLLQLLLLILLCLALMRPVLNMKRGAGKLTVILIDRSASMATKDVDRGKRTRLQEAKRLAHEIVDSMSRNDNACVIAFDEAAETLCPLTPDAARLRLAIDSIEQTDRPTRLKLAYQLAEAQATFIEGQNRENIKPDVFLYSDGRALDFNNLSIRANVTFSQIGAPDTSNVAIVAMSARRNYERPTEVQVFARLANYGTEPVEADVNLLVATQFTPSPSFSVYRSAKTYLYPDRWDQARRAPLEAKTPSRDSVEFKLELTTGAVIRLEQMHKENDGLAADDIAQVVVPSPRSQSVLLVTDGNYYLERLKGTFPSVKEFDILHPVAYEQQKPVKYDVIIFDKYSPKFLPQAGSYMYFLGLPPQTKVKQATSADRPLFTHQNYILDWKRDHPILRGLNIGKRYVEEARKLDVPLGVERLVEGTKGPLIVLSRDGQATNLIVAFDLMQSDWPLKMSFPVFMYNALQYMALGAEMDQKEALAPGATLTIPLADVHRVAGERASVRLSGPAGSRDIRIPESGEFVLPALERVGLYTLDLPIPGYDRIAVNLLDANESNLVPADRTPGGLGQPTIASGKSRMELWWWLALAALPLLLIEWWVYTRRVHL